MQKRRAAFSGSWYPDDPGACREAIERFLGEGKDDKTKMVKKRCVGGIVPHAGWFFSGSIACRVIAAVATHFDVSGIGAFGNTRPDVIMVFGMHMHPSSPACVMSGGHWETPLGDLEVHGEIARMLAVNAGVHPCDATSFPQENTIELQLPFIKHFFPEAAIVPVGVPPTAQAETIGKCAVEAATRQGLTMAIIGSTDMTHYGSNYGFSPKGTGKKALAWVKNENDRSAIDAMVAMESQKVIEEGLKHRNLCCSGAVAAAISAAKSLGAVKGIEIDYATSHDKSPGESFVGYSGVVFVK